MKLDFDAETEQGTINFKGVLTKEEVDFLLQFAILSLMARGTLPVMQINPSKVEDELGDGVTKPETLN